MPKKPDVHKLNAYTFLGRRMECALTGDHYADTEDWDKVTCPDCRALRTKETP